MRVLVTGGLGFIGSSVVERLLEQGAEVVVWDSLVSNVVEPAFFEGRCGLALRPVDHRAPVGACDVVVHCASPVGAAGILALRGGIASGIVADTAAVVDFCRVSGARLVYVSSSEVYGFSGTYSEGDDVRVPARVSPRIEYAVGKLAAEAMVRLTPGLRVVVVRPFNVAGPRQVAEAGFVVPTFAEAAVLGEPLPVFGDGGQVRAFTGVEDVARFIVECLPVGVFDGRVVNVGNPANRVSVLELAGRFNRVAGLSAGNVRWTSGKREHGEWFEEAEGRVKVPDISLARGMGWRPRVGLDELVEGAMAEARVGLGVAA